MSPDPARKAVAGSFLQKAKKVSEVRQKSSKNSITRTPGMLRAKIDSMGTAVLVFLFTYKAEGISYGKCLLFTLPPPKRGRSDEC